MKTKIALALAIALTLSGCDSKEENTQKSVKQEVSVEKKSGTDKIVEGIEDISQDIKNKASKSMEDVSKSAKEVAQDVGKKVDENIVKPASKALNSAVKTTKEATQKAIDATKEASKEALKTTKKVAQKAVDATTEATKDAVDSSKKMIKKATSALSENNDKGKALYTKCVSCHGINAEKKALNKSQIIADWDKEKILNALQGYKNKTYGGAMKGIMNGQVSKFSQEQLEQLAEYISTLKK